MNACAEWLADRYLLAQGFTLTELPDGRRSATRDNLTYLTGPACGHDPKRCPPHRIRELTKEAA